MYLPNQNEAEELNLKDFQVEEDSVSWEHEEEGELIFMVLDEDGLSGDYDHCPAGICCEDEIKNVEDLKAALNDIDNWLIC